MRICFQHVAGLHEKIRTNEQVNSEPYNPNSLLQNHYSAEEKHIKSYSHGF